MDAAAEKLGATFQAKGITIHNATNGL